MQAASQKTYDTVQKAKRPLTKEFNLINGSLVTDEQTSQVLRS